jgi:hypothetical protein
MLELMANAGAADPLDKILPWLSALVIGVLGVVFKFQANAAAERAKQAEDQVKSLRLEEPVPEIPTRMRKVFNPPSWDQHVALERRVGVLETDLKAAEEKAAAQYLSLIEAGHARENSIKEKMDAQTRELHARLDDQFGPRPVKKTGGAR